MCCGGGPAAQYSLVPLRSTGSASIARGEPGSARVACRLSIGSGAALPYIPEAVPRLVFVDRHGRGRGGRARGGVGGGPAALRTRTRRGGPSERDLPPKPASDPRQRHGCDVAGGRTRAASSDKGAALSYRDHEEVHVQGGAGRVPKLRAGGAARHRAGDSGDAAARPLPD